MTHSNTRRKSSANFPNSDNFIESCYFIRIEYLSTCVANKCKSEKIAIVQAFSASDNIVH